MEYFSTLLRVDFFQKGTLQVLNNFRAIPYLVIWHVFLLLIYHSVISYVERVRPWRDNMHNFY